MKFKLSILSAVLFAPILAHTADFEVKGYGVHTATGVTYYYSVANNTASNLADPWHALRVEIGMSALYPAGKPELVGLPLIYSPPAGSPPVHMGSGVLSMTAPTGWNGFESGEQLNIQHTLVWELDRGANDRYIWAAALLPGQTLTGLSVTRLAGRDSYLNTGFIVSAKGAKDFIGRVTKQDTLPPVLSVTLTPNTLKANEKLVSIAAILTVTDDYDPMPEIKLESITANEPLEKEDIKDAQIGTDDRQFKLKAGREGKNKAGRIYTVTYSATDATGNKATANATVTVPHDERKKDD